MVKVEFLLDLENSCDLEVLWSPMLKTDAPQASTRWMEGESWLGIACNDFDFNLPWEDVDIAAAFSLFTVEK